MAETKAKETDDAAKDAATAMLEEEVEKSYPYQIKILRPSSLRGKSCKTGDVVFGTRSDMRILCGGNAKSPKGVWLNPEIENS